MTIADVFAQLRLSVLERGWLSSNNIVFGAGRSAPATVVDTGYDSHADQTSALVSAALGHAPLGRVLNTHLHSDHCGGNAALQAAWGCEVWVPEPSFEAVTRWDAALLTFELTDQRCRRFSAQGSLRFGDSVRLADADWQVIAAPGHDPDAVMLFQPDSRVIITADALWEERLAINFPELAGAPGFGAARAALDTIEALAPLIVIPGHGRPFTGVAQALANSRRRLDQFEADPSRHVAYAERALTMFHMLDCRESSREALVNWLAQAPIFAGIKAHGGDPAQRDLRAESVVQRLVDDGLLHLQSGYLLAVA